LGAEAEVDFGEFAINLRGEPVTCVLFAFRLSFSGKAVHKIFASGGSEAFLEGHVHAFTTLGGVPTGKIRYDNLRAAVAQVLGFTPATGRDRSVDGVPFTLLGRSFLLPARHRGLVETGERACPVGPAVLDQITDTQPGQQVLLDRTLDLMLITALRAWFTRPDGPIWYRAYTDPVTGHALRLLNADPAHPWTVATLATTAGVSRAALAKRFTTLLGQPPMTYLREHRLAIAADLLRDPDVTLDVAARHVGFSTAFALSAAFKKAHGISPSRYRTELAADARQP
jgi:AraC-like DNA-binding protein